MRLYFPLKICGWGGSGYLVAFNYTRSLDKEHVDRGMFKTETVISNRIKEKVRKHLQPREGLKRGLSFPLLLYWSPDSLVPLLICQVGPRPQGEARLQERQS